MKTQNDMIAINTHSFRNTARGFPNVEFDNLNLGCKSLATTKEQFHTHSTRNKPCPDKYFDAFMTLNKLLDL
jgi:hypothetical protein